MSTTFKQMSTFEFLVDAIRQSVRNHNGERPLFLRLGPAALCALRHSPEMRCLPWVPEPGAPQMLYGVQILEIRHGIPPQITHADGREEWL